MEHSSPLEKHFASFLMRLADVPSAELELAARLVSEQTDRGHICVDLKELAATGNGQDDEGQVYPESGRWVDRLLQSGVVGKPGEWKPLVLDGTLLYLQRYFHYERLVADFVFSARDVRKDSCDEGLLTEGLNRLFGSPENSDEPDWQKEAARKALTSRFCVITGGPGTGKTTTVARLLALYLEQKPESRVLLCAPTGKAAARLQEAISKARNGLDCRAEIKELIPQSAFTIHRLLGWSRRGWRYHDKNPLPADLIVVDEASMVDLPLMTALMSAVPSRCSLLLLGDRDQLASVQPGSVLGDLCRGLAAGGGFSLAELKKSYRFAASSGIGAVSRAVNRGDGESALAVLQDQQFVDVIWHDLGENHDDFVGKIMEKIFTHHAKVSQAPTAELALKLIGKFVVLTALRRGPFGAEGINRLAVREIAGDSPSFHGRPVMISRNDYAMHLYNGDTGIIVHDPDADGDLRACFPEGRSVRKIICARLPEHETAFAMTIHKSQGSEFDHVIIVLPPEMSPVLCRELIYTGLTRAVKSVEVWGRKDVFVKAVATCTSRRSGLAGKIACI